MTSTATATPITGLPTRLWLVIRETGERHFVDKEPLEGISKWAEGTGVLVVEYRFGAVVHTPPPEKVEAK